MGIIFIMKNNYIKIILILSSRDRIFSEIGVKKIYKNHGGAANVNLLNFFTSKKYLIYFITVTPFYKIKVGP